eukprot:scaffold52454_cov51-Phaeocystis_antarctica.AAC.1
MAEAAAEAAADARAEAAADREAAEAERDADAEDAEMEAAMAAVAEAEARLREADVGVAAVATKQQAAAALQATLQSLSVTLLPPTPSSSRQPTTPVPPAAAAAPPPEAHAAARSPWDDPRGLLAQVYSPQQRAGADSLRWRDGDTPSRPSDTSRPRGLLLPGHHPSDVRPSEHQPRAAGPWLSLGARADIPALTWPSRPSHAAMPPPPPPPAPPPLPLGSAAPRAP